MLYLGYAWGLDKCYRLWYSSEINQTHPRRIS